MATTRTNEAFAKSGSAAGLGDIMIRAKYNFLSRWGGGLAAAIDVRTPTGDETNLLGTGALQTKVYGIASCGLRQAFTASQCGLHRLDPRRASGGFAEQRMELHRGIRPRGVAAADADRGCPRPLDSRSGAADREADRVFDFVQAGAGAARAAEAEVAAAGEVARRPDDRGLLSRRPGASFASSRAT